MILEKIFGVQFLFSATGSWRKDSDERFLEEGRKDRMEGRRRKWELWLRLSARRLAVVNTFSLVSLQMNTAIEATYNINVAHGFSLAPTAQPLWCVSLPPTLTGFASIQNGHINLIISSVIRLADEERLRDGRRLPLPGVVPVFLTQLFYATGSALLRRSDGYIRWNP